MCVVARAFLSIALEPREDIIGTVQSNSHELEQVLSGRAEKVGAPVVPSAATEARLIQLGAWCKQVGCAWPGQRWASKMTLPLCSN